MIATQDWHPVDHQSFASEHPGKSVGDVIDLEGLDQILWPDHCVQEQFGAELATGLNTDGIHQIIQKGTGPQRRQLQRVLRQCSPQGDRLADYLHSKGVDEVHVMGLATDYCVKFTALDAIDLGFRTVLLTDGIRGVELNEGDCARGRTRDESRRGFH